MENVKLRVERFLGKVDDLCRQYGRDPAEVSVLAATKYADVTAIQLAIDAGIHLVGENRIQDAQKKLPLLDGEFRKHFIGHLQTNKVRQAVTLFDCIESVDSLRLAEALDVEARRQSRVIDFFIQVKISNKESQYGVEIGEVSNLVKKCSALRSLRLTGLMVILPQDRVEAEGAAADIIQLFSDVKRQKKGVCVLSMGMSHDYDIALKYGATELRIGSLFFGE